VLRKKPKKLFYKISKKGGFEQQSTGLGGKKENSLKITAKSDKQTEVSKKKG